jgi:hypothetical protein
LVVSKRLAKEREGNMNPTRDLRHAAPAMSCSLHPGSSWLGPSSRKEAIKMKNKRWLIAPVTAAVLAVGALGSVAVYADTTPPAAPAAAEAAEPTTPEAAEPNEPALPGGGHADADGTNVDNQFDGVQ